MCLTTDGNKVQVCTVGDLKPGDRFRDPEGNEFVVTHGLPNFGDFKVTVNIDTGATYNATLDLRLGTDRKGRLYASRYLNPPAPAAVPADTQDPGDIMRGNNP